MSDRQVKNDKIAMWGLYGTIGIIFGGLLVIGIFYKIITDGMVSFLIGLAKGILPYIIGLAIFVLMIYIAGLISEQLVPVTIGLLLMGLMYYLHHSWTSMVVVAVLMNLYFLVDLQFEDEEQTADRMKTLLGFTVMFIITTF